MEDPNHLHPQIGQLDLCLTWEATLQHMSAVFRDHPSISASSFPPRVPPALRSLGRLRIRVSIPTSICLRRVQSRVFTISIFVLVHLSSFIFYKLKLQTKKPSKRFTFLLLRRRKTFFVFWASANLVVHLPRLLTFYRINYKSVRSLPRRSLVGLLPVKAVSLV